MRAGDIVARLGGDEFAVLLENLADVAAAESVARKLTAAFAEPHMLDGHQVSATVSIGITVFPTDRGDPETLIKNADIAMYQAKNSGRNNFKFFTESMHREIVHQHQMAQDICRALDAGEFLVLYQPQYRLDDRLMAGAEALLRWRRADGVDRSARRLHRHRRGLRTDHPARPLGGRGRVPPRRRLAT